MDAQNEDAECSDRRSGSPQQMYKDSDNERLDGTKESSKDRMDITLTLRSDDHTTTMFGILHE